MKRKYSAAAAVALILIGLEALSVSCSRSPEAKSASKDAVVSQPMPENKAAELPAAPATPAPSPPTAAIPAAAAAATGAAATTAAAATAVTPVAQLSAGSGTPPTTTSPSTEDKRPMAQSRLAGQGAAKPRVRRPALAASLRAFGLGDPSELHMPEDYSLGQLQDYRSEDEAESGALAIAKVFLEGLAGGKLDPKLLVPYSREALAILLAPAPKTPDVAKGDAADKGAALPYRLGKIALSSGGSTASLRVRLASAPGEERLEGWLTLGKLKDAWYVEALSLDPEETAPLSFDPSRRTTP